MAASKPLNSEWCEEMPRRGSFIWPPVTLDTPEAKAGRYMAN
jgi:hypothetical protein